MKVRPAQKLECDINMKIDGVELIWKALTMHRR